MVPPCRRHAVLLALALVACGPPKLGPASGESSDGSTSGEPATESTTRESTTETETSTTESETSTTDPGDPTGNGAWIPEPDSIIDCDPLFQDCPVGEKCVAYASTGGQWDDNKCVPVMGEQAHGEPCTYGGTVEATDNCDATSACWDVHDVDGELVGICYAFCLGENLECPPESQCLYSGAINFCIPTCDPLAQDCGAGLGCYWANNGFNCVFTTEDLALGEPCDSINDCAPGLGCLTAEVLPACASASCCGTWCNLALGDAPCEAAMPGTVCEPFFEVGMSPPGYEQVGVCILPP